GVAAGNVAAGVHREGDAIGARYADAITPCGQVHRNRVAKGRDSCDVEVTLIGAGIDVHDGQQRPILQLLKAGAERGRALERLSPETMSGLWAKRSRRQVQPGRK